MTKPAEGPFSGSGPKGYKRTPDSIERQVCDALEADGYVNASGIEVDVSAETGDVALTGKVPSERQHRRAEECVASIQGIGAVHNCLEIDGNMDASGTRDADFGKDAETAHRPVTTIGAEPQRPETRRTRG